MAQPQLSAQDRPTGFFQRMLDLIEVVGNKLPSPFILFSLLAGVVLVLSAIFEGTAVTFIGKDAKPVTVKVISLLNAEGFRYIVSEMVPNFIKFPPLGLVVVMMLAMGLAENTGMVSAFVRRVMLGAPPWAVTATVMFLGINGNLASDAAMVFMPAAAAAVYAGMGRNPILGMAIAFAATAAGFSANVIPAGTDALISGITATAVKVIPQTANSPTHMLINYYFMSSSVIILTIVGTIVAEKIVEPRLNRAFPTLHLDAGARNEHAITPEEARGLKCAGITALIYIALLLFLTIPETGLLRDAQTRSILPNSPLLSGIIPILFFFFLSVGIAFGIGKGVIKKEADIPKYMAEGLQGMTGFLVTAFAAAQFIAWFTKSNLATIIAVRGAEFLRDTGFTGIPLIIGFILLSALVDMFMVSGSAKWLIMAPIFVPMFGLLGYEPALTQAAYRIGESATNPISPLQYYVPVMLGIMSRYIKDDSRTGMGTLMATQMPFAIWFLIAWSAWLIFFMVFNIPLGPGAKIYL
ncbi:MAG: AbgT family transporter [Negativicutes bacterium]|nr:AbgT family transporter [Negativicutes bacterium]